MMEREQLLRSALYLHADSFRAYRECTQLLASGQGVFLYLRTLSIYSLALTYIRAGIRKETIRNEQYRVQRYYG